MKIQTVSNFRLINLRSLIAMALFSGAGLLTLLTFAVPSGDLVSESAPGFHAAVVPPGAGGGSESYIGMGYLPPRAGTRVLAWQAGAKYNVTPDGVNWNSNTGQVPGNSGGGDVSSAVDAFGAYYIAEFCSTTQGELQACLHKSSDGGATWTTTTIANVVPNPIDRPWIDVYPKLSATATITNTSQTRVYLEYHTFTDGQTYLNTSTNGGGTFGPPVPASIGTNSALPDSNCNTVPSGVVVDQQTGTAYALWLSGDDVAENTATGCNVTQIGPYDKAWVTKSSNDGLTWAIAGFGPAWTGFYDPTTDTGDNANKIFGSLAVDYSGQIHVLLTVRKKDQPLQYVVGCENPLGSCVESKADTDLVLVTSPDGGAHWTAPRDVNLVHDTDNNPDTNPHSYFYPWIYGGAKGMVDAIYYFAPTNRPNDTDPATNSWTARFSQITNAIANPPGVSGCPPDNLTMNGPACYIGAGPQVIQETQVSNNVIHVGQICTFGIFCDLVTGGDRSLLDSNNITIDPAGGANATWTANANPSNERVELVCQNSGRSLFDGANSPEPFAGGAGVLNGCYGPADMSITKTASPNPVQAGGTLTYHLTVTNNGMPSMPSTTSGVTVTDTLPAGVILVSAVPSSGTCSGTSTITCKLGIFPSGVTATVDITVTAPNSSGAVTNTATVTSATADPDLSNNTATQVTNVSTVVPTTVVSRKTHGSAGTFDIDLPFNPPGALSPTGIECRTGGASGDFTMVFTFPSPLTAVAGATVSSGHGSVRNSGIGADSHDYVVNLTGVTNQQQLSVTLSGIQDSSGHQGGTALGTMKVLLGDTNADTFVNSADIGQTKSQSGHSVGSSNFREDVNVDGFLNSADIGLVKSKSGTALP
jgi:uncharacterized repeat protein (TIGR01451 family)